MAANSIEGKIDEVGFIILGNSGAGKSFICNLLIGEEIFANDFDPNAVTTTTRFHRVPCGSFDALIYDIPGLIEADQERIDRNKREIEKAFKECPNSIVLFVWTHKGGRVVHEDIIAFQALNKAYQFSSESLAFVLNSLPPKRSPQYDEKFTVTLANHLKPITVSIDGTGTGPDFRSAGLPFDRSLIDQLTDHLSDLFTFLLISCILLQYFY